MLQVLRICDRALAPVPGSVNMKDGDHKDGVSERQIQYQYQYKLQWKIEEIFGFERQHGNRQISKGG
jgi:hypothetical protein